MHVSVSAGFMDDHVVITGAGMVCSLGHGVHEAWDALLAGRHGIRPIEGFDVRGFGCQVAAQIRDLDPLTLGINSKDSRIMDTHAYMLIKCARDAYHEAKLDTASITSEDIGFFAGMGMVDYRIEDLLPATLKSLDSNGDIDYDAFFSEGYKEIYPLWPLSMLNNVTFCQAGISLNLRGENTVFSPHADSGAQAIIEGMHSVFEKKSRVALAGGVSEKISPLSLARAHLCGVVNTEDHQEAMLCRPFSAKRRGTILGEGCGVLALELLASARARGISCLALLTGYGAAFGTEGGNSGPTTEAIALSMREALDGAGLKPSDISVVIAHGDGTFNGDKNEIEALQQVFSERIDTLYVFSSKGALGHLLAGAPLVDVILGVSMIKTGMVPLTLNSIPVDDSVLFHIADKEPLSIQPRSILIHCQSFEGHSVSLIIEAVT